MSPVIVREARAEEVWPLRLRVLRPGRAPETAQFPGDESARHFVALREGAVVGVASVFDAPFHERPLQLRGMATDESVRGSGVGRALLDALHARFPGQLWCNARTSAEGFYARGGWRTVSDVFDIADVGPHVKMLGP